MVFADHVAKPLETALGADVEGAVEDLGHGHEGSPLLFMADEEDAAEEVPVGGVSRALAFLSVGGERTKWLGGERRRRI